jgi:uncharacterized membrane protein
MRRSLVARLGDTRYRGLFSLLIVASILLLVLGWRAATPAMIYQPPAWGHGAALVLMLAALILFAASGLPTNIKRFIRHPQLTGVATWAIAHLLCNGDDRSAVLFGGIGLWALIEILVINRREGPWQKPPALPLGADIKPLVGGVLGYVVLLLAHPYLFGVSPM